MYLSLHWRILSFELRGSHDATTRTNTRYFGWWELISSIISSCMRAEYFCCSVKGCVSKDTYRCNRSKTSGSHRNKFLVRIPKQRCDRSPPSLLGYSAQSPELLRRGSFHTAFGLIRSSASRRDSATRCRRIYLHLRRTPTR